MKFLLLLQLLLSAVALFPQLVILLVAISQGLEEVDHLQDYLNKTLIIVIFESCYD